MKKGEKHHELCNSDCVEPLWFGWLGQNTRHMDFVDHLCGVHKRRSDISQEMNSKRCTDGGKFSEYKKQTNSVHFEFERRDVAQ